MTTLVGNYSTNFRDSSEVSKNHSDFLKDSIERSSRSITLGRGEELIQELDEMYDECSSHNWDGYEAVPLSKKAMIEAYQFIENLPMWLPMPELVPEPTGYIGFQWDFGDDKIVTASLSGENTVVYAAILGSIKRTKHGSEIFNKGIPEEIIKSVGEIRA